MKEVKYLRRPHLDKSIITRTGEEWALLNEDNYYQVSSHGRVRSSKKSINGKIMSLNDNGSGYLSVGLTLKGKTVQFKVSRLVAMSFIPNDQDKPIVNHIDGVKYNNNYSNLEWATSGENVKHAWNNGLAKKRGSYLGLQKRLNIINNYICHDVYVSTPKGRGRVIVGQDNYRIQYENGGLENLVKAVRFWGNDFKLELRQLFSLTKEIEHNGEKFVPLQRLNEMRGVTTPSDKYIYESFDDEEFYCYWGDQNEYNFSFEKKTSSFYDGSRAGISPQLEMFNKLFEWHLDPFGLIESNQAIEK